jgi:2-polyprenyl-6-methoxyphenol hydroxylase-like FAD-dependent oxidoreductase
LKAKAAAIEGHGEPVQLITSSRVETADAQTATITLSDGSQRTADVLIGADGVHSNTRSALSLHTKVLPPFKGKHNAFRFTMPRKVGLEDPETEKLVNINGTMDLWYSEDRKIVLYSTSYNEILNFVCIHPAELSESSDDYQTAASVEKLLDVYADFHPNVVKLLSKVDPAELKVYRLYDMPMLSTYVSHRLALIGDAAHPFTPHLAQGGAMAIEDGVSLGIMLDKDVTPQEVPERLQLYNQARHHRSSTIQEYSRLVGGDGIDSKSDRQVHQLKGTVIFLPCHGRKLTDCNGSPRVHRIWI